MRVKPVTLAIGYLETVSRLRTVFLEPRCESAGLGRVVDAFYVAAPSRIVRGF